MFKATQHVEHSRAPFALSLSRVLIVVLNHDVPAELELKWAQEDGGCCFRNEQLRAECIMGIDSDDALFGCLACCRSLVVGGRDGGISLLNVEVSTPIIDTSRPEPYRRSGHQTSRHLTRHRNPDSSGAVFDRLSNFNLRSQRGVSGLTQCHWALSLMRFGWSQVELDGKSFITPHTHCGQSRAGRAKAGVGAGVISSCTPVATYAPRASRHNGIL